MSSIAIITARGSSKRIPKKNIKDFPGKPIIAYSIEAALGSGVFDEVMVSTDSEEIAQIACKYGASVPFLRSAKTSNDFAATADVIEEVRNGKLQYQYPENFGRRSQDLERIYHDCGQFYICRTVAFRREKRMNPINTIPIEMPDEEAQDIDNLSDWMLAEVYLA